MAYNMNASISEDLFDISTSSVFSCPILPQFTWDLRQIIYHQIGIAVTLAVLPLTVFLNILVIVAVKKIRELATNSNILIACLAAVDFLVGAVSMPLTITLDAQMVRGTASKNIVCIKHKISGLIFYIAFNVSFYHLVLIAWERYVAIVKWMEYKVILTKERVQRNSRIIWVTTVISNAFYLALAVTDSRSEILLTLNVILIISYLIGLSLMAYFYFMVYIKTRKLEDAQIRRVNTLIKARSERRTAYTVFLMTVAVLISVVPLLIVLLLALFSPVFRSNLILRMAEIFLQLNSLVNPAVYFYRNNRYRKAALRLLGCGKPRAIEPGVLMGRHARQNHGAVASLDVKELVDIEKAPRLRKGQSYEAETQRGSLPNPQEHVTITVTAQTENVPREEPERVTVESLHHRKSEK